MAYHAPGAALDSVGAGVIGPAGVQQQALLFAQPNLAVGQRHGSAFGLGGEGLRQQIVQDAGLVIVFGHLERPVGVPGGAVVDAPSLGPGLIDSLQGFQMAAEGTQQEPLPAAAKIADGVVPDRDVVLSWRGIDQHALVVGGNGHAVSSSCFTLLAKLTQASTAAWQVLSNAETSLDIQRASSMLQSA